MPTDWVDLLVTFLHDPPDKAVDIRNHESRALQYASLAAGRSVSRAEIKGIEDQIASVAERLPMPTAGGGERAVGPVDGRILVRHPLSGHPEEIPVPADSATLIQSVIRDLASGSSEGRPRFFAVWRLLRDRLATAQNAFARLPADTRVPDHTIWHHLDTTAALKAAAGAEGAALLSFHIGPVQSFIMQSRTVRDLWTASAILSWLSFRSMLPVVKVLGPAALVFPALRGVPHLDRWLRREGDIAELLAEPALELRMAPCLPNRFLALVPGGAVGQDLAAGCEAAARDAWRSLGDHVRAALGPQFAALPHGTGWDRRWEQQVGGALEVRSFLLGFRECGEVNLRGLCRGVELGFANAGRIRDLAKLIPKTHAPGYPQDNSGDWQAKVQLSAQLLDAGRRVRHFPSADVSLPSPPKCTLTGTLEQMGPDEMEQSRMFWEAAAEAVTLSGVRLRKRDRLSSVALVKRFAAPAFLARELGLSARDLRFSDTATIAAAEWLENAGIDPEQVREDHRDWSGQWLHQDRRDAGEDAEVPEAIWSRIREATKNQSPPAYYAVLAMDGDEMGKWLSGRKSPTLEKVLHPRMTEYYRGLGAAAGEALSAQRPVGPALHASISEALANFALHVVPGTVSNRHGVLVYAGGDDVLALLPARQAVGCAAALRRRFGTDWEANRLLPGCRASMSAGIAVAHHKEDLRFVLQSARDAEKEAKQAGRDILCLKVLRRSGEHASALLPWSMTREFEQWIDVFLEGTTDRWTYKFRQELPGLSDLPLEAVQAELGRLLARAGESADRKRLEALALPRALKQYLEIRAGTKAPPMVIGDLILQFAILCQSASFLARGRDR